MQYSCCNFLLDNFKTILLPKFETQKIIDKEARNIEKKTAREMITWCHFKFQQRLIWKSQKRDDSRVIIVSEKLTTKTCGRCGLIKENVEGDEIYHCSTCGLVVDRDVNAARNILIRNIGFCDNST